MFKPKPPPEKSALDEAIDEVLETMQRLTPESDDYPALVKQLTKLYALKEQDKPESVSKDTLAIIVGNVLIAFVIVGHERAHVVTSKALTFLTKAR